MVDYLYNIKSDFQLVNNSNIKFFIILKLIIIINKYLLILINIKKNIYILLTEFNYY